MDSISGWCIFFQAVIYYSINDTQWNSPKLRMGVHFHSQTKISPIISLFFLNRSHNVEDCFAKTMNSASDNNHYTKGYEDKAEFPEAKSPATTSIFGLPLGVKQFPHPDKLPSRFWSQESSEGNGDGETSTPADPEQLQNDETQPKPTKKSTKQKKEGQIMEQQHPTFPCPAPGCTLTYRSDCLHFL